MFKLAAGPALRLDQLLVLALAQTSPNPDPARRGCPSVEGERLNAAAKATVALHGGIGGCSRTQASVQHVLGGLITYRRHFRLHPSWFLGTIAPNHAWMRWTNPDPALPDVVDLIASRGTHTPGPLPDDAVIRFCDLNDPRNSTLTYPGQDPVQPWHTAGSHLLEDSWVAALPVDQGAGA